MPEQMQLRREMERIICWVVFFDQQKLLRMKAYMLFYRYIYKSIKFFNDTCICKKNPPCASVCGYKGTYVITVNFEIILKLTSTDSRSNKSVFVPFPRALAFLWNIGV